MSVFCQSGGLSASDSSEIKLSIRPIPDSDLVEFRCESIVKSELGAVVSLFEDTDSMPEWVFRMKQSQTLKRISPTEVIAYAVIGMPWPLEDRDSVIYTTIFQDENGVLCINGRDYPDFFPDQNGMVRMTRIRSEWRFEPMKDGFIKVIFTGTGDPGGVIPLTVFNNLVYQAPFHTVKNFCEIIKRDKYKKGFYSYIREYPDGN